MIGRMPARRHDDRWRRLVTLTPKSLAVASVLFVLADWASQRAGDSVIPGGPLDETAHVLTTLLVLWALGPRFCRARVLVPALIVSVLIDADHVPGALGSDWLTAGTPRPYTHSLLTVAVVLALALAWRGRRVLLAAIALGLVIHFWRDVSEPGYGVALLWPWSDHGYTLPHASYLAVMAGVVAVDAARCRRVRRPATERARVRAQERSVGAAP